MPTIVSSTNDGYVRKTNASTWAGAKSTVSGTAVSTSSSSNVGISAYKHRFSYYIYRSFFQFDTEDVVDEVDSATLYIRGKSQSAADVMALQANSGISTLSGSDFNNITGWVVGSPNGSGGASNIGNVTKYSNEYSSWTTSGYNNIILNANAYQHMQDNDNLYVAVVEYDHDLLDIAPTGYNQSGLYYANASGSFRPYIEYTTVAPSSSTSNSIFFGANF